MRFYFIVSFSSFPCPSPSQMCFSNQHVASPYIISPKTPFQPSQGRHLKDPVKEPLHAGQQTLSHLDSSLPDRLPIHSLRHPGSEADSIPLDESVLQGVHELCQRAHGSGIQNPCQFLAVLENPLQRRQIPPGRTTPLCKVHQGGHGTHQGSQLLVAPAHKRQQTIVFGVEVQRPLGKDLAFRMHRQMEGLRVHDSRDLRGCQCLSLLRSRVGRAVNMPSPQVVSSP